MENFNLTPEQLEIAKAAKSPEELVKIAKSYNAEITLEQAKAFLNPPVGELSDEELENVAGGGCSREEPSLIQRGPKYNQKCPFCLSKQIDYSKNGYRGMAVRICKSCGKEWEVLASLRGNDENQQETEAKNTIL